MLGMLLLLGPSFSSSAAGCFHSMSASEVAPSSKRATPPKTTARISDAAEEHGDGDVVVPETAVSQPADILPIRVQSPGDPKNAMQGRPKAP